MELPVTADVACSLQLARAHWGRCLLKSWCRAHEVSCSEVWCLLMQHQLWLQGARNVTGYFPAGKWYNLFDNSTLHAGSSGRNVTLSLPLGEVGVHQQGGTILALAQPTQRAGG